MHKRWAIPALALRPLMIFCSFVGQMRARNTLAVASRARAVHGTRYRWLADMRGTVVYQPCLLVILVGHIKSIGVLRAVRHSLFTDWSFNALAARARRISYIVLR
jgi:hypothetical protein